MTTGFVKNEDLLKEDSHVEDLLDFSAEIDSFSKKLEEITKPSIIGLVGKFGSGKSTMLHQIQKNSDEKTQQWIEFDAWKYPERKDMWEGFVLDFAEQIGLREKTEQKLDNKSKGKTAKKAGIKALAAIPFLGFIGGLGEFFDDSPVKRIYQIQNILRNLIEECDKDLFIVLEDIDRSGDYGIYFLETLKQFISNHEFKHNVIIIVPIGTENFDLKIDSYLKCLDLIERFNPQNIDFMKFISEIIDEDYFNDEKIQSGNTYFTINNGAYQLASFFHAMMLKHKKINIRVIKKILREANLTFKNQFKDKNNPDCRMTILVESMKLIKCNDDFTYHEIYKEKSYIPKVTIFSALVFSIRLEREIIYDEVSGNSVNLYDNKALDIKIYSGTEAGTKPVPFDISQGGRQTGLGILKFYFEY